MCLLTLLRETILTSSVNFNRKLIIIFYVLVNLHNNKMYLHLSQPHCINYLLKITVTTVSFIKILLPPYKRFIFLIKFHF